MADVLNAALHAVFADDTRTILLGEDIADPYGGAFGVTRGLSTKYPDRVLSTPISEAAIVGAAGGLAMCGDRVVVEVMFGDFITLCLDPIVNFISKSVTMYGRRHPMPVVVRCPVGGNRGYGPTHSQSPHKHLIGVPNLNLFELSPFHDPRHVFARMFAAGEPAVFFEDKVLYTRPAGLGPEACGLYRLDPLDPEGNWMRVRPVETGAFPDLVVIAPGGLAPRVVGALEKALVDREIEGHLLVPAQLFPLAIDPVSELLAAAGRILVVEDGVAGGGWAAEVTRLVYDRLWGRLRHPVRVVQPHCAVIPAAAGLERRLLVQEMTVYRAVVAT